MMLERTVRFVSFIGLCLATATGPGCEAGIREPVEIRHPTEENTPAASALADVVEIEPEQAEQRSRELVRIAASLRQARLVRSVGTMDGPAHTVWGRLQDVAVDDRGSVHVLDTEYNEIRRFDRQGRFIDAFGREGSGPMEFRRPEGIAFTASGVLAVASRNSGIKTFVIADSAAEVQPRRAVPDVVPTDVCTVGERVYVRARLAGEEGAADQLVHELDLETGAWRNSFSSTYRSEEGLVSRRLSRGLIVCLAEPAMVVTAFNLFPYLRAYTADGEPRWTSSIDEFRPAEMIQTTDADGRTSISVDPGDGSHRLHGVTALPDGYVLVQVMRFGPADPERPDFNPAEAFQTYVLSAVTGEGAYVSDALPRVLHADRERLYTNNGTDYPIFSVYRY